MSDVANLLQRHVESATEVVRQYAGSDSSKNTVVLLDALIAHYQRDLEEVTPDRLIETQAQIRQCRALRGVLLGEPHSDPRL